MDVPPTAKSIYGIGIHTPLSLPQWYTIFFPNHDTSAGPATTSMGNGNGACPVIPNWAANLDSRILRECKPKWQRVPKAATPLIGRQRTTIMKTILSLPYSTSRRVPISRPVDKHYVDKENEISESKRTRLTDAGAQGFTVFMASQSKEETRHHFMRAKAQVVNHIALHPDSVFDYDGRDVKLGGLSTVVRQKRRVDSSRAPGASLAFYRDLLSVVVIAWETHGLDTEMTDLVEHMLSLGGTRRDPRAFLAALGKTDLSAITDVTEPDSTLHPAKTPSTPAAWSSAARRKARVSGFFARRKSSIAPAGALSSPLKQSGAAPTTPMANVKKADYAPNGSTRVFEVPSFTDSTASISVDMNEAFSAVAMPQETNASPVRRPGAPTPTQWSQEDPSTPVQITARDNGSPRTPGALGLVAALPDDMAEAPPTPPSWKKWDKMSPPKKEAFQFSEASFAESQASDHYSVFSGKANRRRSEPLLQHLLKDQARRFSASPQKFFAGTDTFEDKSSMSLLTPVRPQRSSMGAVEGAKIGNDSNLATPMPSYFRASWAKNMDETPAAQSGVYNIDMRQNPDIFGTQATSGSPQVHAVGELARMADAKCEGDAKVVVHEENGKLVVRFKLPAKYAYMFPANQSADESRFNFSPSAISSSPRIKFIGHEWQQSSPLKRQSMAQEDAGGTSMTPAAEGSELIDSKPLLVREKCGQHAESSSESPQKPCSEALLLEPSTELVDFNLPSSSRSSKTRSSPFKRQASQIPCGSGYADERTLVMDFDSTHQYDEAAPCSDNVEHEGLESSVLETPTQQLQREIQEAPSSGLISDISFEPSFQTPTFGHLDFNPANNVHATTPTMSRSNTTVAPSVEQTHSARKVVANHSQSTPSKDSRDLADAATSTPTLPNSFTPVNKQAVTPQQSTPKTAQTCIEVATSEVVESQAEVKSDAEKSAKNKYDFDSPGRDFMYEFIRKSKPKNVSTTENGSPVPTAAARQPLGAKSPNTGSPSPRKNKRKHEDPVEETGNAKEKPNEEPAVKKLRGPSKPIQAKRTSKTSPVSEAARVGETKLSSAAASASTSKDEEPPRRSTRLKPGQEEGLQAKSYIPTPTSIKLRGVAPGKSNGGQPAKSSVRNEQVELSRQTSTNTRKNRGNAESVQQILARISEELSGESADDATTEAGLSKRGKNVSWKDPIESFQQTPKTKKTKTVAKPKATQGKAGVTKQKATPKSKIAQAAKSLGMASNGTPAKRTTRAMTRSQS